MISKVLEKISANTKNIGRHLFSFVIVYMVAIVLNLVLNQIGFSQPTLVGILFGYLGYPIVLKKLSHKVIK